MRFECGRAHYAGRLIGQGDFALAAITATQAFLAQVVIARVLGAAHTDSRGFLFTDAADEWHEVG